MTEDQIKKGNSLTASIEEVKGQLSVWRQAVKAKSFEVLNTEGYSISQPIGQSRKDYWVRLDDKEFELLKFHRIMTLESKLKELETEFNNL